MRSTRFTLSASILLALVWPCLALPLRAQSLGDVAKREAERRKTVKEAGKVLTNKDVPQVPQADSPPAVSNATEPDAAEKVDPTTAKDPAAPADAGDGKATEAPKDEKYWSERYRAVHEQLERDQVFLEAVQTRVNALTTDYVNRDDPAQRAAIGSDRQKSLAEVTRLNAAILADKKAVADFEDEARRASVPPGWLR